MKNLVVLRSMTKYFSLAGFRLGFMVAPPGVIKRALRFLPPWNVSLPAQVAGKAALEDKEYQERVRAWFLEEGKTFFDALSALNGATVYPSAANFFMIKMASKADGALLGAQLMKEGFLIRELSTFTGLGPNYIRVALRERADNERLVGLLESYMPVGA